jgi:hypothetical protein
MEKNIKVFFNDGQIPEKYEKEINIKIIFYISLLVISLLFNTCRYPPTKVGEAEKTGMKRVSA